MCVCVTDKIIIYNLVLLCLGLSEVAQNLHNRQGPALYRYHPIPPFVIPPGRLKSSEPIGDDPNLCMALHLAHSFVRYSCIYIYIYTSYIYLYIVIRISCQVCLTHHHFANCWWHGRWGILFDILDDGDGLVTITEFCQGISKLRGNVKPIDFVTLRRENSRILKECRHTSKDVRHFGQMLRALLNSNLLGKFGAASSPLHSQNLVPCEGRESTASFEA